MSRKDFVAIANAFAQARIKITSLLQWQRDRAEVEEALAETNPRFDRARFERATEL